MATLSIACSSAEDGSPVGEIDVTGQEVDETGWELSRPFWFATPETAACSAGATFDDESGFCVKDGQAVGPFTNAMVAACREAGEKGCDEGSWPLERAKRLRGEETCPKGASVDPDLGVCVEGGFAYGPFDMVMIDECRELGGTACDSMKWDVAWIAPLPAEEAPGAQGGIGTLNHHECTSLNDRLFALYSTREGYNQVSRAAMRTLGTRRNGCATWLSHAIRQVDRSMPIETNTENIRDTLLDRGWTVIRNQADLRPGDVIITADRRGWRGHPDHVYMFAGWHDAAKTIPLAVDNQGFTHARRRGKSPIAYGLRAPDADREGCSSDPGGSDASAPSLDSCAGRADGWYCSQIHEFSAFRCQGERIIGGWQCGSGTVCRPDAQGRATMSGANPGCFGSR